MGIEILKKLIFATIESGRKASAQIRINIDQVETFDSCEDSMLQAPSNETMEAIIYFKGLMTATNIAIGEFIDKDNINDFHFTNFIMPLKCKNLMELDRYFDHYSEMLNQHYYDLIKAAQ